MTNNSFVSGKFHVLKNTKIESSLNDHIKDVELSFVCWERLNKHWLENVAKSIGVNPQRLRELIVLSIKFHDLGKSSDFWQSLKWDDKHQYSHAFLSGVFFLYGIKKKILTCSADHKTIDFSIIIAASMSHHSHLNSNNKFEKSLQSFHHFLDSDSPFYLLPKCFVMNNQDITHKELDRSFSYIKKICSDNSFQNESIDIRLLYDTVRYAVQLSDRLGSAFLSEHIESFLYDAKEISWTNSISCLWRDFFDKNIERYINNKYFKNIQHDRASFQEHVDKFNLFDFQMNAKKEAKKDINNSLLIIKDCGGGKTVAAYVAANEIIKKKNASRIIYVSPTRILALDKNKENSHANIGTNIFFQDSDLYEKISKKDNAEECSVESDVKFGSEWIDNSFNCFFTITTPDQLLIAWNGSSKKISQAQRSNICSSVIVFDEIHSYNGKIRNEIISLIKELTLRNIFVICLSATVTSDEKNKLINACETKTHKMKVIDEGLKIKNNFILLEKPLVYKKGGSAKGLLYYESMIVDTNGFLSIIKKEGQEISSHGVIIYLNTVEEVQATAYRLSIESDYDVISLHARYFVLHKYNKSKKILEVMHSITEIDNFLSKTNKYIVIMNQVGILGINITSHTMFSKASTMSSIIQKNGRLGRIDKVNMHRNHYIIPFEENEKGFPYQQPENIMHDMKNLIKNQLKGNCSIQESLDNQMYVDAYETDTDETTLDTGLVPHNFLSMDTYSPRGHDSNFTEPKVFIFIDDILDRNLFLQGDKKVSVFNYDYIKSKCTVDIPRWIIEHKKRFLFPSVDILINSKSGKSYLETAYIFDKKENDNCAFIYNEESGIVFNSRILFSEAGSF